MKRKKQNTQKRGEGRNKVAPSQPEEPKKDTAHWTKVLSEVPKAVLVNAVAESILQLPDLQQVIVPKLEKALSQIETLKKHMKVLDVGSISKKLGAYYTSFSKQMKYNWHDMWEDQGIEMSKWSTDTQEIFDAIYALCIDEKTAVGEHEKVINALNELWSQLQRLDSLNLRVTVYECLDGVSFNVGSTSLSHFDKAFWKMYLLVLERAQSDPLIPKETFQQWTQEAVKMDTEGWMYHIAQKSKSSVFDAIADTKLSKFKSKPSYEAYETIASRNSDNREFINELLTFLEKHAMDSYPRGEKAQLAIKCMLFSNQLNRAIKFADSLKNENDLDPSAAQLILFRVVKEKKKISEKPSIKIDARHLDWCVDTLGSIWKDVKANLLREIFDVARAQFTDEMIDDAPADFGDKEQEKFFEAVSKAYSKRSGSEYFGFGGYYSDDSDDEDNFGGRPGSKLAGIYRDCVSLFRAMKSIPEFPQKELDAIRQNILYTREKALESLVFLHNLKTLWNYEWDHSSKYQHLADACEVLLEDNKELIDKLKKEANAKTKQTTFTLQTVKFTKKRL